MLQEPCDGSWAGAWMKIATVLAVGGLVVVGSRFWGHRQQSCVGRSMSWSRAPLERVPDTTEHDWRRPAVATVSTHRSARSRGATSCRHFHFVWDTLAVKKWPMLRRRQEIISPNNQQQQSLPTFTPPTKKTQKHWILSEVEDIYISCLKLNLTYLRTPFLTDLFFSYV